MTTETQTQDAPRAELIPQSAARELAQIDRQRAMAETTFGIGVNPFSNGDAFKLACAMAERISESTFIPTEYQGQPSNVLVALDYAARLNISPVMLMQNMDVVKGRPGLRGSFYAGLINKSPLFSRLRYEWRGTDNPGKEPTLDYGCRAYATEQATGEVVYGAWIDWRMVKGEGWDKNTKWTTMREQMFMYRATSFWARVNASDITLGMYESEELRDALEGEFTRVQTPTRASLLEERLAESMDKAVAETGEALRDGSFGAEPDPKAEPERKPRGTRRKVKDAPDPKAEPEPDGEDDGTRPELPADDAPGREDEAEPTQTAFNVE